jgi:hypothetical protein
MPKTMTGRRILLSSGAPFSGFVCVAHSPARQFGPQRWRQQIGYVIKQFCRVVLLQRIRRQKSLSKLCEHFRWREFQNVDDATRDSILIWIA